MLFIFALSNIFGLVNGGSANSWIEKVLDISTTLPFDENSRLSSHLLLYTSDCLDNEINSIYTSHREKFKISDEVHQLFYSDSNDIADDTISDKCDLICVEKGTHIDQIQYPLPYHKYLISNEENLNYGSWVGESCQRAEVGFLSYAEHDSIVYWISPDGKRVVMNDKLSRGEKNTFWQQTFLGHKFEIVDAVTGEILISHETLNNAIIPIGTPETQVMTRDVVSTVKYTLQSEWHRSHSVVRTFTELGFNRGRLPHDLWGSISAYYYNNRNNKVLEEWGGKGVFVNWWEADCFFIPMPWELKRYWQSRLKDLVEQWSGVELELTDIYGMRRYEEGARLLTHVDREHTHAASLIINVAQGNIRKPWHIEVYDFADRLHEIEMNEGDIVYYESARCLHGRMQPLEGGFYVNLFAHYRPIGDPLWFQKPNPDKGPAPLMDIGECKSNGTTVECTNNNPQLKFLSPKLQKITSADDLFEFWKEVAPNNEKKNEHEEL
eukprot:gene4435-6274_t